MTKNLEDLWITFQQNVYPTMIDCLAEDLGVTVESIKKLGIGFFPGEQAWIFAERDHRGNVIGLQRRYKDGKKFMIKSSKRGLIYEINKFGMFRNTAKKTKPNYLYSNFVRCYNAGVCCPLCNKDDWCLVSSDDVHNPSAVICGRSSEGAKRYIQNSGYLHQLQETISSGQNESLQVSNKPLVVVEGSSDVLCAMDLGYTAIGKPSAEGGNDLLVKLLKGKNQKVIIIGENDEAGQRGLESTFQILKPICKSTIKILPPDGFSDLRDWGPTVDEFEKWIKKNKITKTADGIFETTQHYPLALEWLETQKKNGKLQLRYFNKDWYRYSGLCYEKLAIEILEREFYKFFGKREAVVSKVGELREIRPLNVNEYFIRNIRHIVSRQCFIEAPGNIYQPFHIKEQQMFDIKQAVVFKNGIYYVNDNRFESHNPDIFITSTLSYNYNPNAKCDLWLWFVEDIFNGNQECIDLLQEWFGYNLIASNHLEQFMFFFGVPGSGKSTTTDVLYAMLGSNKCGAANLEDLSNRFGLQPFIHKQAIIISEDKATRKVEADKILQRLKRITGQDWLPVDIKFRDPIQIKPIWRITYAGNDILPFDDAAWALGRRLNLLYFENSYEKPDRTLKNRLVREAQGIAIWALEGLKRLLKNGEFTVPLVSKTHIQDFKSFTNSLAAMIDSCCRIYDEPAEQEKHWAAFDHLYELHKVWYEDNGLKPMTKIAFGMKFKNTFPNLQKTRIREQGLQVAVYQGIEITQEAFRHYLGGLK